MPEAIYTARPLTDEEKIFAEKNHNLMYRYIRIHELDLEDWYMDYYRSRQISNNGIISG